MNNKAITNNITRNKKTFSSPVYLSTIYFALVRSIPTKIRYDILMFLFYQLLRFKQVQNRLLSHAAYALKI